MLVQLKRALFMLISVDLMSTVSWAPAQCYFNVGPPSRTTDQPYNHIGMVPKNQLILDYNRFKTVFIESIILIYVCNDVMPQSLTE